MQRRWATQSLRIVCTVILVGGLACKEFPRVWVETERFLPHSLPVLTRQQARLQDRRAVIVKLNFIPMKTIKEKSMKVKLQLMEQVTSVLTAAHLFQDLILPPQPPMRTEIPVHSLIQSRVYPCTLPSKRGIVPP